MKFKTGDLARTLFKWKPELSGRVVLLKAYKGDLTNVHTVTIDGEDVNFHEDFLRKPSKEDYKIHRELYENKILTEIKNIKL